MYSKGPFFVFLSPRWIPNNGVGREPLRSPAESTNGYSSEVYFTGAELSSLIVHAFQESEG